MKRINVSNLVVKLLFFSFIFLIVFFILYGLKELLTSFLVAFLLSLFLNRFVYFFESIGIPRLLSVIIVIFSAILVFVIIFQLILPKILEQINKLYELLKYFLEKLPELTEKIKNEYGHILPKELNINQIDLKWIFESIIKPIQTLNIFAFIPYMLTFLLITPILLFIFMLEGDSIYQYLMSLVPNRYFEMTLMITYKIRNGIVAYLRALIIQILILGGIMIPGLMIIQLPYGIVLGGFAAIINIVPYIGPIIGAIPIISVTLISNPYLLPFSLLIIGLAQFVDNVFTQPVILAKSFDVHPILAILALITFQNWMGVLGMVIAIPVTGIILMIIETMYKSLKSFDVL